jgi:hypothetical protein
MLVLAVSFAVSAASGSAQQPAGRGAAGAAQPPAGRGRGAAEAKPAPWFGIMLPPKLSAVPAVVVGDRGTRPAIVPQGEAGYTEFTGATIRKDLETIVGFSKESRATKEVGGSGQMWGRISGYGSSQKTIEWAAEQFRQAGIKDVKLQPITQDAQSRLWMPVSWEFKVLGNPSFGPGTADVVLESATPLGPDLPGGTLTAPLVYVGTGEPSVTQHLDVKGKIAVQLVIPQAHMVFERGAVSPHSQDLSRRGAVAVVNILRQPGNEYAKDLAGCGAPCFNIGGRDGYFLEQVLDRAAVAGTEVRATLKLSGETKTNLKAVNAVAVIPGRSEEVIILDAHADAWFDGAGDNGDGLSVLVALARHFAKPANRPDRTLALIASAGHHTSGVNGPRSFLAANPDLAKRAILAVNIEHVAQRNFAPGRSVAPDGYRDFVADSGEAPITVGVTNESPYLDTLVQQGVARYGTNFVSAKSPMASGESGGFAPINGAVVTIMQAPPLYHTSGETLDIISTPGLERMARFLAYFVKQAGKAPVKDVNPPDRPLHRTGVPD